MATQAQNTNWRSPFLAPQASEDRRLVLNYVPKDPSGCISEGGLVNNLPIPKQIRLTFWAIILDVLLSQKANTTGWGTSSVQCFVAQAAGNETRSFKPKNTRRLEAHLYQRLFRGDHWRL
jgi:hypothetical protein